ncbi:MAG: hypothetical protein R3D85_05115 [Paracoccaceae bacterium]
MFEPPDTLSEQLRMADRLALPGAPIGRHKMGGGGEFRQGSVIDLCGTGQRRWRRFRIGASATQQMIGNRAKAAVMADAQPSVPPLLLRSVQNSASLRQTECRARSVRLIESCAPNGSAR